MDAKEALEITRKIVSLRPGEEIPGWGVRREATMQNPAKIDVPTEMQDHHWVWFAGLHLPIPGFQVLMDGEWQWAGHNGFDVAELVILGKKIPDESLNLHGGPDSRPPLSKRYQEHAPFLG